jgi:hypothetical protein
LISLPPQTPPRTRAPKENHIESAQLGQVWLSPSAPGPPSPSLIHPIYRRPFATRRRGGKRSCVRLDACPVWSQPPSAGGSANMREPNRIIRLKTVLSRTGCPVHHLPQDRRGHVPGSAQNQRQRDWMALIRHQRWSIRCTLCELLLGQLCWELLSRRRRRRRIVDVTYTGPHGFILSAPEPGLSTAQRRDLYPASHT